MTTMERSETIRGPKRPAPAISDKFQARLDRVKMLEHEQQMEDLEALKHTPVRPPVPFHNRRADMRRVRTGGPSDSPGIVRCRQDGVCRP